MQNHEIYKFTTKEAMVQALVKIIKYEPGLGNAPYVKEFNKRGILKNPISETKPFVSVTTLTRQQRRSLTRKLN
jgi:hypothetical protein